MPLLVLFSGSPTSQPDSSFPNLVLMAIYVGLTLVLAIVAVVSIFISSRLSRDALKASDKQSKEAIGAVQKQIEASEKQTKETIAAINRQIEASEKQAQEALYNQHKPIIIPVTDPTTQYLPPSNLGKQPFSIGIRNKGAGVAMNAFSIVGLKGFPDILCSSSTKILIHGDERPATFDFGTKFSYPENIVEEVPVFPQGVFGFLRLMVTYSDLFNNKYFVVYDYSEEFGWRQLNELRRVDKRLDELVIKKH